MASNHLDVHPGRRNRQPSRTLPMIAYGHLIDYRTPQRVEAHFWQPATKPHLPDPGQVVWAFLPELGNDDEGYGMIVLAQYRKHPDPAEWPDWTDPATDDYLEFTPALWAPLWEPDPHQFVSQDTPEESRRRWGYNLSRMIAREGYYAPRNNV